MNHSFVGVVNLCHDLVSPRKRNGDVNVVRHDDEKVIRIMIPTRIEPRVLRAGHLRTRHPLFEYFFLDEDVFTHQRSLTSHVDILP